jgi:hypothetical protein
MLRRLPEVAFGLLAVATVVGFFVVQHLKTSPPAVVVNEQPTPSAFNPVHGRRCTSKSHQRLNYRQSVLTISSSHNAVVSVYIVRDRVSGHRVVTLHTGTSLVVGKPEEFVWNGRAAGGQLAGDGKYIFRIVVHRGHQVIDLTQYPVQIVTRFPVVRILSVRSGGVRHGGARGAIALSGASSDRRPLTIHFTPGLYRRVWIDIYRAAKDGTSTRLGHIAVVIPAATFIDQASWNGELKGRPVPAGTYRIGITAQDLACDQTTWPTGFPAKSGTTSIPTVNVG